MTTNFKSAEEWNKFFSERYKNPEYSKLSEFDFFDDMYKQISANTMREAARIVDPSPTCECEPCIARHNAKSKLEQAAIAIEKGEYKAV